MGVRALLVWCLGLSTLWLISPHTPLPLGLQVINQSQVWPSAFPQYSYQPEQLLTSGEYELTAKRTRHPGSIMTSSEK